MKRVLWITSFRPFGISEENDNIQANFLTSLNNIKGADITLHVTQFGEKNVKSSLDKYFTSLNRRVIFENSLAPQDGKYSQSIIMAKGLEEAIADRNYDLIVWSTCDFIAPEDLIEKFSSAPAGSEYCACIMPQYHQTKSGKIIDRLKFNFGLDIFIFNISHATLQELYKFTKKYNNVDWGCYEHFLSSMQDVLDIKMINISKRTNILKFGNAYSDFGETRSGQAHQWYKNNERLKFFLKTENLSQKFATGSMYYLLIRNTRIRDIGMIHIITFPSLALKLGRSIFKFTYKKVNQAFAKVIN